MPEGPLAGSIEFRILITADVRSDPAVFLCGICAGSEPTTRGSRCYTDGVRGKSKRRPKSGHIGSL